MRVLHAIHSLRRGGAERVLLELAMRMQVRGHDALAVALIDVDEYPDAQYSGVDRQLLLVAARYDWPRVVPRLARRFRHVVEGFRPDVIEIHTPTAAVVAAVAGAKVPAVQVFHGWGPLEAVGLKGRVRRGSERWAFGRLRADAVVVSPSMATSVGSHLGLRGVSVIRNGTDLARLPFSPRNETAHPVVLAVGTLSAVKRPLDAVRALSHLSSRVPEAQLWFAGEGPLQAALDVEIQRLGLEGRVRFLGRCDEIGPVLARAHVLWQLSESEGSPLSVLEAMASGVAVVASDGPGMRDLIVPEQMGLLVPVGRPDAVAESTERLLAEPETLGRLAARARHHVEAFHDAEAMADGHLAVLENAVVGANSNAGGRVS